jgi:hypothetical protein
VILGQRRVRPTVETHLGHSRPSVLPIHEVQPTRKSAELDPGAIQYLAIAHMQKIHGRGYLWVEGTSEPIFETEWDLWRVPLQARPKTWKERKRDLPPGARPLPVASVLYTSVDVKRDGTIAEKWSVIHGW